MNLVLFRHAERQNLSLSPRGFTQATHLVNLVKTETLFLPKKLLCSPKQRSLETFAPLSQKLGVETLSQTELDERATEERVRDFSLRVKNYLRQLERLAIDVFVCTHMDWLEEALIHIPSDTDLLKPEFATFPAGGYFQFEIIDGLWTFRKKGVL